MAILRGANTWQVNLLIFILVNLMVVIMPAVDRRVCSRLGINLEHGLGPKNMKALLNLRQLVLILILVMYLAVFIYLVFIARAAGQDYSIHIAPLNDLNKSVQFDSGIAYFLQKLITGDFYGAYNDIHVVKPEDIGQAFSNIMLFVPLGYLLPYVFKFFRKNNWKTVFACCLISALTENMQLIFKRGCYDFDDLLFNTIGGMIGVFLYRKFAYCLTHANWKKDLKVFAKFRRKARKTVLFRYASGMDCGRVTMFATDEKKIYSYFVEKLGFRPRGQRIVRDGDYSALVLELGGLCIEFLCSNDPEKAPVPMQTIMLSATNLDKIRKRLTAAKIQVSDYEQDPYTMHKSMYITGPDGIRIIFGEY